MLVSNSRDKGFKKCSVESVITPKMIFDWQRIAIQLSWLFFENLYTFFLRINIYRSLMIKASFWNVFCLINKTKTYTAQNFVFSPNFLVWKFSENTVFPEFRPNRTKLCRNLFRHNFHTRKLCEIRVLYALSENLFLSSNY